jgi:hypothetical protein
MKDRLRFLEVQGADVRQELRALFRPYENTIRSNKACELLEHLIAVTDDQDSAIEEQQFGTYQHGALTFHTYITSEDEKHPGGPFVIYTEMATDDGNLVYAIYAGERLSQPKSEYYKAVSEEVTRRLSLAKW